jgi:hypothetical protein
MRDGEQLMAVPERNARTKQTLELGPLFAAVFGDEEVAAAGDASFLTTTLTDTSSDDDDY